MTSRKRSTSEVETLTEYLLLSIVAIATVSSSSLILGGEGI